MVLKLSHLRNAWRDMKNHDLKYEHCWLVEGQWGGQQFLIFELKLFFTIILYLEY